MRAVYRAILLTFFAGAVPAQAEQFMIQNSSNNPVYAAFIFLQSASFHNHERKFRYEALDVPAGTMQRWTIKGPRNLRYMYLFSSWQQRNNFMHAVLAASTFNGLKEAAQTGEDLGGGSYGAVATIIERLIKVSSGLEPPERTVSHRRISRNYPDLIDFEPVIEGYRYDYTGEQPAWKSTRDGVWADGRAHVKSGCRARAWRTASGRLLNVQTYHVRCEFADGQWSNRCPDRPSVEFRGREVLSQRRLPDRAWMEVQVSC